MRSNLATVYTKDGSIFSEVDIRPVFLVSSAPEISSSHINLSRQYSRVYAQLYDIMRWTDGRSDFAKVCRRWLVATLQKPRCKSDSGIGLLSKLLSFQFIIPFFDLVVHRRHIYGTCVLWVSIVNSVRHSGYCGSELEVWLY
jgi:hypothetical protein